MTDETTLLRLDNLEEKCRDQAAMLARIGDSLNRIELALGTTIAKSCPKPGHCVTLETELKTKWDGDKFRFERLEKRASENDVWHHQMEEKIDSLKTVVNRGLGGIALLVFSMPFLTWFVVNYLANK